MLYDIKCIQFIICINWNIIENSVEKKKRLYLILKNNLPNYQISKKNYWTKFPKILIPFPNIILYMANAKNHSSYKDSFIPSISGEIYTFYILITLKLGFFFPIQKCTKKAENKPNSHVIILKNNYTCKWKQKVPRKKFSFLP